jgi:hypothetical protein
MEIYPLHAWSKLPWVEFSGRLFWRRLLWPAVLLEICWLFASLPAMAQTNLVTNGTFQVTGGTTSFQFGTWGPYTPIETVNGWTSTGYNFIFLPGSNAATSDYGVANVAFWGPAYNVANGYTGSAPGGTNFMALDADYPASDSNGNSATAAASQTINGLTPGMAYNVSFAWAGAQQEGYTGATTENLTVSLGASSKTTQTINLASEGFSGWMNQTFSFVATSSTEVLSFLAGGSPAVPPFVLVANVSMTQAPEPTSAIMLITGVVALAGLGRRRLFVPRMRGA